MNIKDNFIVNASELLRSTYYLKYKHCTLLSINIQQEIQINSHTNMQNDENGTALSFKSISNYRTTNHLFRFLRK